MKELKGTPKQIAFAENIRENLIEGVNEKTMPQLQHIFAIKTEKTQKFITELQNLRTTNEYLNNQIVIAKVRQLIENVEDAKFFIDNQSLLSFFKNILK